MAFALASVVVENLPARTGKLLRTATLARAFVEDLSPRTVVRLVVTLAPTALAIKDSSIRTRLRLVRAATLARLGIEYLRGSARELLGTLAPTRVLVQHMLGEAFEVRAADAAAALLVEDAVPGAVEVFGAAALAGAGAEVVGGGTF